MKWLNNKSNATLNFFSLIIEASSAAFSGFLIYFIYEWQDLNVYVAFCLAGLIGNFGAKGIEITRRFIVKLLGLKRDDISAETEKNGGNKNGTDTDTDKRD